MSDVLLLCGLGAAVYGTWQLSEPAAWIVGGLLLAAIAVGIARGGGNER